MRTRDAGASLLCVMTLLTGTSCRGVVWVAELVIGGAGGGVCGVGDGGVRPKKDRLPSGPV